MKQDHLTALVVGATGLVGHCLTDLLLADPAYDRVISIARRPSGRPHPKLVEQITDLDRLDDTKLPDVDHAFCCLGTTIRIAGSRDAFRKVDFGYVEAFARLAARSGAQSLAVVTAMGANPTSAIFYNRVKGEAEEAARQSGIASVTIARPSFIAGERQERRPGEGLALKLLAIINPVVPRNYQSVPGRAIARAMLESAKAGKPGLRIMLSGELQDFA